ncbi:MAG: AMP-binding protein [Chitinophagales bacterium]|nr:AMP-binding protein [Chitinophagales bacterium]
MGSFTSHENIDYKAFQRLTINGKTLIGKEIIQYCIEQNHALFSEIALFLTDWFDENPEIEVQTSGSTGEPQKIKVFKNQMLQSASATAQFFDFKENENMYLCLPVKFIAGKMMIIRALYSQMNLVILQAQNSHPIDDLPDDMNIHFAAFVPMQLKDIENTKKIKTILLGGAPISTQQEDEFQSLKAEIFHSYGMTETLSHVAIRKVNGNDRSNIFKALPNVTFQLDERNCLVIDVPFITGKIITNDIVELLNSKEFIWKGRFDNVINSGGLKYFPEELERKIQNLLQENYFFIGLPDEILGEKICLFIEHTAYQQEQLIAFRDKLKVSLNKYEFPKAIFFIDKFSYTLSSKIKRQDTVQRYFSHL